MLIELFFGYLICANCRNYIVINDAERISNLIKKRWAKAARMEENEIHTKVVIVVYKQK
jgi:hypothetical protein